MTVNTETPIFIPEPQAGEPEITMAPLIDVVFLLLIFFMVTTTFPDKQGLTIEKPESRQATSLEGKNMTFTVTSDGRIDFEGHTVTIDDVERLVRNRLALTPATAVLLQVDRRATTATLINVMDACKLGGAAKLSIATDAAKKRH